MANTSCRILLVDPSVPRAQSLCEVLSRAGWEVWPGRSVREALVLSAGLAFDVVLAHQTSMRQYPELWEQLSESVAGACWLVHSDQIGREHAGSGGKALSSDPALILAVLMLLLERKPASRAHAA